jgi:hypothetical protein
MKKYFGATLILTLLGLGCGYKSPTAASQQPGAVPAVMQLVPNTANSGDPERRKAIHHLHDREPTYDHDPRVGHRDTRQSGSYRNQSRPCRRRHIRHRRYGIRDVHPVELYDQLRPAEQGPDPACVVGQTELVPYGADYFCRAHKHQVPFLNREGGLCTWRRTDAGALRVRSCWSRLSAVKES